jgi:hypothetical protein
VMFADDLAQLIADGVAEIFIRFQNLAGQVKFNDGLGFGNGVQNIFGVGCQSKHDVPPMGAQTLPAAPSIAICPQERNRPVHRAAARIGETSFSPARRRREKQRNIPLDGSLLLDGPLTVFRAGLSLHRQHALIFLINRIILII